MKKILLFFIFIYQKALAPHLSQSCGFEPTCSVYGAEAIRRHGAIRGGMLAAKRIARCQPRTEIVYDPVPDVLQ